MRFSQMRVVRRQVESGRDAGVAGQRERDGIGPAGSGREGGRACGAHTFEPLSFLIISTSFIAP